jgi:hypothetical protein
MKKMLVMAIALAAVFGVAASASAADYTVNMCGASAQAGFWEASGAAVVEDTYNCNGGAVLDWEAGNDKNMIIRAQGCTVDATGTNDDTVYVRYLASNSITGCENYTCGTQTYVVPTSCNYDPLNPGSCNATEDDACQLGCSDVPCDDFDARTIGNDDGCHGTGLAVYNATSVALTAETETFQGVVVPFGFIVNNAVTHHVCDYTNVDADIATRPSAAHWAYNKAGWQGDPTESEALACRGDYKCLDDVCQDGYQGTDQQTTCSDASECKELIVPTCVQEPLDNVNLLMVCHIFSGAADNWRDFGPGFPELPITRCMRHAGSGTHQTMINSIIDLCPGITLTNRTEMDNVCHYKSSSDLSRDCVGDYAGGIGYVDADKVMFRSGFDSGDDKGGSGITVAGAHQLTFNGSAPSRYDVASGKYLFFSSQVCFMDDTLTCFDGANDLDGDILRAIQTTAANPTYLAFENFGQRAYFWATQGEMLVERLNGDPKNFPTNKSLTGDDRFTWTDY